MTTIVDEQQDKQEFTGSREARRLVMGDGIDAFLEFPITGVGAGQFKNYNPPERQAKFLETHNVLIQVAAETGILGLLAFVFLIWRAVKAAWDDAADDSRSGVDELDAKASARRRRTRPRGA